MILAILHQVRNGTNMFSYYFGSALTLYLVVAALLIVIWLAIVKHID